MTLSPVRTVAAFACTFFAALVVHAQTPDALNPANNRVAAAHADTPITLDGALDEPAWRAAEPLRAFYEIFPGDHIPPPVETEVRYAYDARHLYVGVHARDPQTALIRRPFVRRDGVRAGQDYVQVYIDPFNTRRSSQVFRVNVRGNQTDGVTNEATSTEDDTPDFPFDVATRLVDDGWQAEFRIPFSSLHVRAGSRAPWAIMAYRGWPRSQNTQIASGPLARDVSCFMCFATTVTGIRTPDDARSLLVTPYVGASVQRTHGDAARSRDRHADVGVDVKWVPAGGWVVDGTINPDFSELEADAPQVTGNARHALSLDEKRPFFLESADLLQTPLPIIYTRTIVDPDAGLRVTRRGDDADATAWYARDQGGGRAFLPGPFSTGSRPLDMPTDVFFGRARWNMGRLALAVDASDRAGGDYRNSVLGADATWFATDADVVSLQWLRSRTRDPAVAPDAQDGLAAYAEWVHSSSLLPWKVHGSRIDRGFRADNGYLPSADIDELYLQAGPRFFDVGILSELQPLVEATRQTVVSDGRTIDRWVAPGVFFQGPHNFYGTATWHYDDRVRAFAAAPERHTRFVRFDAAINPTARWAKLKLYGDVGALMDFDSGQVADGHILSAETLIRPTDRLEIEASMSRFRLRPHDGSDVDLRQEAEALIVVYHRSVADSWRLQWTHDVYRRRRPVAEADQAQSLALVFAHRPDWRDSLFLGVGVGRHGTHAIDPRVPVVDTQRLFVKWSHAFGR